MKIRIQAPWAERSTRWNIGGITFISDISLNSADGILVCYKPAEELYSFNGPRAFYCAEPITVPSVWCLPEWQKAKRMLHADEILHPGNINPKRRVMHITHADSSSLAAINTTDRITRAVAIVANNGNGVKAWPEIMLRNNMITHSMVDLYGPRESWSNYKKCMLFRKCFPTNYKGELEGDWTHPGKIELVSKYKAAVCMENSCEPFYFSEKFIDAVRGGCIPIYHAHPTVAEGILKGALWVDPADHGFDPEKTISFSLKQDIKNYQEINGKWLLSDAVKANDGNSIYSQIAKIFKEVRDKKH